MASAYHHIEDDRKERFLTRVGHLLTPNGVAVVGENILPSYDVSQENSYAAAVRLFYEEVLRTAEADGNLPDDVRGLIQKVAKYGVDGEYEYKTDISTFQRHVVSAGLRITSATKIWPMSGPLCMTTGGNYVFTLQKS